MKKWFLILSIIYSGNLLACSCVTPPFVSLYHHSDFIAKAKILKVTPGEKDSEFNEISIQILEIYKGEMVTSIKAVSYLKNNCGIVLPENSTWLLFANKNARGVLRFDYCSGSKQIDQEFDLVRYPDSKQKFEKWLNRTTDILRFLTRKELMQTNEFSLIVKYSLPDEENLEGYVVRKNHFAIYELTVSADMSIKKVSPVIKFDNPKLSKTLATWINKTATVSHKTMQKIPAETKLLLIIFYYPPADGNKSFISVYNL